jgi:pimeloyl-ACP methyl ester carboxylesterase
MKTATLVILLHGIGHSSINMAGLNHSLRKQSYDTRAISYPSLRHDIPTLAAWLQADLDRAQIWDKYDRVHFVTHSMGGLVVRQYLETYRAQIPPAAMGHVVMIAPPNGGSEVADFLRNFPPYKWIFGPAGQQLTTTARATDQSVPWYPVGVIAGDVGWPFIIANRIIPGKHDGRVAVERTRLPAMTDHITIPATHSLISWKKKTHQEVINFLSTGKFTSDTR